MRAAFYALALSVAPAASDDRANDTWLTFKSRLALMGTEDVDSGAVHVDTRFGTVTLFGRVPSESAKAAAERRIAALKGVKRVDNLLEIVAPEKEKAVAAADDVVKRAAEATLENAPTLAKSDIRVLSVVKGVVMLGGRAEDTAAHVHAVDMIHRLDGVRRVDSRVNVENDAPVTTYYYPTEGKDVSSPTLKDAWTTTQVKMRLIGNEHVPSMAINVDTWGSTVTLFGKVDSDKARIEAEREALKVRGVTKVNNELRVDTKAIQVAKVKDKDLEADVRRLLSREDLRDVGVDVKEGVIKLSGRVRDESEKVRAAVVSRSAKGARAVKSELRVVNN